MSIISSQNFDQEGNSDATCVYNFEKDDLVTFQNGSTTINISYSQLTKYSKLIRNSYLFSDVVNRFPQEIQQFQEEFQLLPESINYFFQLLQQNFDINQDFKLTFTQCTDLLKISKLLEVKKISFIVNKYIRDQKIKIDFAVDMIKHELKAQKEGSEISFCINDEMEKLLTNRIDECLSNEKFKDLPIQIIHRVFSKSSPNSINNDKLFNIIMKSLNKFCVLFNFLDLRKLSEDQLDNMCEIYSKSDEKTHQCFNYLKCNLELIREINAQNKKLKETNDELERKISSIQKQFSDSENQLKDSKEMNDKQQIQIKELEKKVSSIKKQFNDSEKQLNDSKELNNKQQIQIKELERKVSSIQKQFSNSETNNNQLQSQVTQLQNQLTSSDREIKSIQRQFDEISLIKGEISVKTTNGLCINAKIRLIENGSPIDASKSKFIISTSGEKSLGSEAYKNGYPITSLNMRTGMFLCRAGTYFVRCIIFDSRGRSSEIVSNAVTTRGSSATFGYEGKAAKISLCRGRYKLEVWGAKGGDSTGNGSNSFKRGSQSSVQGGFGGYSQGILNLDEQETAYVYVGGEGCSSGSSDGSMAEGGFPDGGGAKTGHYCSNWQTVPGTGGGSTSIRIGRDTDYARVIVAGGGGGAGGSWIEVDPGGFGGGPNGGNCSARSTRGIGESEDKHGDPGRFGQGATGKYCQKCDSRGGGWYGGGSGGCGFGNMCSSGGGGSGWTFTASSLRKFQEGDASNASKFTLKNLHFLTEDQCLGGNEEFPRPDGNGKERGHARNG